MSPLKIAVATRCLGLPLQGSLRAAASFGAVGVQLDARDELKPGELSETGRRQFLHQFDELGLAVASLTFPTRHALYEQQHLDARLAAIRQTMQFAWQLRAQVVTVRTGRVPADKDALEYRLLVDVLADLARHGNQVGVTLALSPARDSPQAL